MVMGNRAKYINTSATFKPFVKVVLIVNLLAKASKNKKSRNNASAKIPTIVFAHMFFGRQ